MVSKLIDAHVHCLPDREQGREFMHRVVGRSDPARLGYPEELFDHQKRAGVHATNVIMYTATSYTWQDGLQLAGEAGKSGAAAEEWALRHTLERVRQNNSWCAGFAKQRPGLTWFCGTDPARMTEQELLAEVERCRKLGASGVKLALYNLRMYGDDPRLSPLYDFCEAQGMPILTQCGGDPAPPRGLAWAHPAPFGAVLPRVPKLRLVFAHMCWFGYLPREGAEEMRALSSRYADVCTDFSMIVLRIAAGSMSREAFVERLRYIGADHVLFASNYPLADPVQTAELFHSLPLTPEERDLVGHRNFERLTR